MTSAESPSTASRWGAFAVSLDWNRLPAQVQKEALRAWLNWVACAVGGAHTPTVEAAVKGLISMGNVGDIPVPGRRERLNMESSALLGCISSSAHTYDDTHLETITHPTGPVASALFSASYRQAMTGETVSGARFLTALVLGLELECRLSCALSRAGSHFGWYMTGLSGGVGAAAAVSYLLRSSAETTASAIGLAASQASGFRATHGSMAITHVPGAAARAGVQSAYLAAAGFNCGDIAIDGRNGLLQVLTGGNGSPVLFDELGVHFEFLNNTYKPYPCGIVIHPMIDACLTISAEEGFDSTDIEHVDMLVHPDALHLTWRKLPTTELDAQVSLYHWAAAALVQRSAGIKQGELDCIMDPEVRQLQDKMHVEPDAALANNQARLSIHMKSGKVHSRFTDNAIGSVTNPMTDAQLVQKFFGLVVPVLGEAQAQTLLKSCQALALADDVTQHLSAAH